MDLGLFRRDKTVVWAWVVIPALATGVSLYALSVFGNAIDQQIEGRRALAGIAPQINARLAMAKDVLIGYGIAPPGKASELTELLGARLNEAAQRHNFAIDSSRIDEVEPSGKGKDRVFRLSVRGEGPLQAVMQFIDDLQSPQSLVAVESVRLKVRQLAPELVYDAELALQCHQLADGMWSRSRGGTPVTGAKR
jgi:hypothetical protein